MAWKRIKSLPLILAALMAMTEASAGPAVAQIRLFKDGQIVTVGPTRAERRARQMGVMMGAMSGRRPAPDPDAKRLQNGRPVPATGDNSGR
jgi:hypothetical protein